MLEIKRKLPTLTVPNQRKVYEINSIMIVTSTYLNTWLEVWPQFYESQNLL